MLPHDDRPGHPPWQCQRIGATTIGASATMRWELRNPWSHAVYCCATCYDTGGTEHGEWDISFSRVRPCTSSWWPDEVLTALYGPPPLPHQHANATGDPVASVHLAAHMDDAAEPDSDDDDNHVRVTV